MDHRWMRVLAPPFFVALLALLLLSSLTLAQATTPTPPPAPPAVETHPAAIHKGTCSQPTPEPAYTAGDVRTFANEKLTPIAPADFQGTLKAPPVLSTTDTQLKVKLSDLLTPQQPYVLIVHQSAQQFTTYLACGEIGGPVQNNQLVIALRPVSNSGYAGLAFLKANGDTTTSNVYLYSQVDALSGKITTPAAGTTPTPGPTIPPTPKPTPTQTPTPSPTPTTGVVQVTPTTAPGVIQVTPTPTVAG